MSLEVFPRKRRLSKRDTEELRAYTEGVLAKEIIPVKEEKRETAKPGVDINIPKKEISGIDDLIKKSDKIGLYVEVYDRDEIEKNYGERFPEVLTALFNLIRDLPFKDFSIILRKKEKLISWYSPISGAVVINLAFNPDSAVFNSKVREVAGKTQQIKKKSKSL